MGGYRFQETQRLPADLVWSALKLPTQCYDWECAQSCEVALQEWRAQSRDEL